MRYKKDVVLSEGLLYRRVKLKGHDNIIKQFVLPKGYRGQTIQSMHNELGHLGMDRTLSLLQD